MSTRRAYQDYASWQSFGTRAFWSEVSGSPLAGEIVLQRLNQLGLINPSETCSADIASGIAVAMHGTAAALLPQTDVESIFHWVKVGRCTPI